MVGVKAKNMFCFGAFMESTWGSNSAHPTYHNHGNYHCKDVVTLSAIPTPGVRVRVYELIM